MEATFESAPQTLIQLFFIINFNINNSNNSSNNASSIFLVFFS